MRLRHLATSASVVVLVSTVQLAGHDRTGITVSKHSDDVRRCSDLEIKFDGEVALRDEETLSAPAASGAVLKARPPQNGGIFVSGAARSDFSITSCEAVAATRRELLGQIRTTIQDGTVSSIGVPDREAVVYYIIEAPKGAALDLAARNGPIAVREFSGSSTVRTENGPVRLINVRGQVGAHAQNGPIHFDGGSGEVELETQNGPIGVRLAGDRWTEGSLTARAQNGPVKLDVPPHYRSGVRVETSQHSPWSCSGACGEARKSWDHNSRSLELGEGPVLVRVSTVNGPMKVSVAR